MGICLCQLAYSYRCFVIIELCSFSGLAEANSQVVYIASHKVRECRRSALATERLFYLALVYKSCEPIVVNRLTVVNSTMSYHRNLSMAALRSGSCSLFFYMNLHVLTLLSNLQLGYWLQQKLITYVLSITISELKCRHLLLPKG